MKRQTIEFIQLCQHITKFFYINEDDFGVNFGLLINSLDTDLDYVNINEDDFGVNFGLLINPLDTDLDYVKEGRFY